MEESTEKQKTPAEQVQEPRSLRELLAQLDAQGITDYRRYEAVRKFVNFRAREKNIPVSGSFELTPLCNLDCRMCYVHLNREQMQGAELLPTEEWKRIMKEAVDAGMLYARLTGGECLTYPGFRELYCYLLDLGVETFVLSNGIRMDADMTDFFVRHPSSGIQVTLYGASEDAYERVTGHRVFGRVMENLHRLRDAGTPLSIAVTPNAFMTDGEEVVRLLHAEGLPFSINAGIISPREETGRTRADADVDVYAAMIKLQKELEGQDVKPAYDADSLPDPPSAGKTSKRGVRCGAGRSAFSVNWHGQMLPCNTFPCEPVDVRSLGFAESWRRINRIALDYPQPAECEGCYYRAVCKHCVAEHGAGALPGHASPLVCRWGKRMVEEGIFTVPAE